MHLSSVLQDRQNDALVSPAPLFATHREPRINSRKLATLLNARLSPIRRIELRATARRSHSARRMHRVN